MELTLPTALATDRVSLYDAHKCPTSFEANMRQYSAARKATNITLSADVLADAKALGINISQSCDQFLRELVRREKEQRWKEEHAAFVRAYNEILRREGPPLDEWRSF